MSKRHAPVIQRQDASSDDHYLKEYQSKLAVQPHRVDQSLFDQINSIMNGSHSRFSSVEEKVKDMQERSGWSAYLNKQSKTSEPDGKVKKSSDNNQVIDKRVPIVIQKFPNIKSTFENYIRDTKGNIPVPAIIDKVKSIHRNDVSDAKDWDDDNLIRLVSKMNLQAKTENPTTYDNDTNLGTRDNSTDREVDPSNTDAFHGLIPTKS